MEMDASECLDIYLEELEKKKAMDRKWYQSMVPARKSAFRAHCNMTKKLKRMKSRLALMDPTQKEYGLRKGLLMLAQEDATQAAKEWGLYKNAHKARPKNIQRDTPTRVVLVSPGWSCLECSTTNHLDDTLCKGCLLPLMIELAPNSPEQSTAILEPVTGESSPLLANPTRIGMGLSLGE
jgi:hypothetical protein